MSCTYNLPVLVASSIRLLWVGSHTALYSQCWVAWHGSESWSHRSGQSSGSSAQHLHRTVLLSALQQSAPSVSEALLPPFLYMTASSRASSQEYFSQFGFQAHGFHLAVPRMPTLLIIYLQRELFQLKHCSWSSGALRKGPWQSICWTLTRCATQLLVSM